MTRDECKDAAIACQELSAISHGRAVARQRGGSRSLAIVHQKRHAEQHASAARYLAELQGSPVSPGLDAAITDMIADRPRDIMR